MEADYEIAYRADACLRCCRIRVQVEAKHLNGKRTKKASGKKPSALGKPASARKLAVIISGMPSVGKTTAAKAIADRFGLRLLAGGDMLKEMAIERGYVPSGSEWWDGTEGMRFLSEREKNPDFDREVDRRLVASVKKGRVVITSYTVPWITDLGLKIWFGATVKTRAKRLAGRDGIPLYKALEIVRRRDSGNRKLYSELYGIDFGRDLTVFNYAIQTDDLSAKEVSAAACELVRRYVSSVKLRKPLVPSTS